MKGDRIMRIQFPQAGVNRQAAYQQQPPYAAVHAINVRGADPLELRKRGGSRPGMEKVLAQKFAGTITAIGKINFIDAAGVLQRELLVLAGGKFYSLRAVTVTESVPILSAAGQPLLTETGDAITYAYSASGFSSGSPDDILYAADGVPLVDELGEYITVPVSVAALNSIGECGAYSMAMYGGDVYLSGSDGVWAYDPSAGVLNKLTASEGLMPYGCHLVETYRDRLVLAGGDNVVYFSKAGDVAGWLTAGDKEDQGQAVAIGLERASTIGQKITALFATEDDALVVATSNTLWVISDDPAAGGAAKPVSRNVGIVGARAWCRTADGLYLLLSQDGVYVWGIGTSPAKLSKAIPQELLNIDPSVFSVSMTYDHRAHGAHIFVTPVDGSIGKHWFIDLDAKAIWPVRLQVGHQPTAVCAWDGGAILGCSDGHVRRFNINKQTDDGTAISSHVLLGPVQLSSDAMDGLLVEVHGALACNSGSVTCRIIAADGAEAAADAAAGAIDAELSGLTPSFSHESVWTNNRNRVDRPRVRGAWAMIWLSSKSKWAYESISAVARTLGSIR